MVQNNNKENKGKANPPKRTSGNTNYRSGGSRKYKPRPYNPKPSSDSKDTSTNPRGKSGTQKTASNNATTKNNQKPRNTPKNKTSNAQVPKTNTVAQRSPNPKNQNYKSRKRRPSRNWNERKIKVEETYEDIQKDNERIEKEVWLEIAQIHNMRLD